MVVLKGPRPFLNVPIPPTLDLDPAAGREVVGEAEGEDKKGEPAANNPASTRPATEEIFTTSVLLLKVEACEYP